VKEFQNRNPLLRCGNEVVVEQKKPIASGGRRQFFRGCLFLFVLVILLGGIVWHFSRFSTGGQFLVKTEDSGMISDHQEEMEYLRLLFRNRYPFELSVTVQLCRMDGDTASPRFAVIDKRSWSFTGARSLYSGSFEARVNIVTSGDGRFHVTDRSGKPEDLLNMPADLVSEQSLVEVDAKLRVALTGKVREGRLTGVGTIREDQMTYGEAITKYCSLPGGHPDKILVITLTPKANYGR